MRSNCILLRGDPIYAEASATAEILPGMLVSVNGAFRTVSSNPTVSPATAGQTVTSFARENEVMGLGIEDAYAEDDNVLIMSNRSGDVVQAWLAAGQNIEAGAELGSVGGGLLGAAVPGSQDESTPFAVTFPAPVLARALETINNSGGGAVAVRINVEVV